MPTVKLNLSELTESERLALWEDYSAALQVRANFPLDLPKPPLPTGYRSPAILHLHPEPERESSRVQT